MSYGQAQNEVNFDFQVKFDLEGQGRSPPQNNRHLNQGVLRLSSKFGDSSVNGWWVIVRTSKWLIHTHTDTQTHGHTDRHTDAGDDNTRRPKLASGNETQIHIHIMRYEYAYVDLFLYLFYFSNWSTDEEGCVGVDVVSNNRSKFHIVDCVNWRGRWTRCSVHRIIFIQVVATVIRARSNCLRLQWKNKIEIMVVNNRSKNTNILFHHYFIYLYTVKCRYNAFFGVQEIDRVIAVTAL